MTATVADRPRRGQALVREAFRLDSSDGAAGFRVFSTVMAAGAVVAALQDGRDVHNVVRLPEVNLETGGDMVTAFVRDEAVDDVLAVRRLEAAADALGHPEDLGQ